ncbi:MAG: hypothetical protein ACRDT4_07280 [Micromonosporaceae bacterium]
MRTVTATAPVRVDLTGGATDCPPWMAWHGGVHVNIAVAHHVRATVTATRDQGITVTVGPRQRPAPASAQRLVTQLARALQVSGVAVSLTLDVPPASGLGTSGAVGVATVAALAAHGGASYSPDWIAEVAAAAERATGAAGGKQDQYAAAHGAAHLWRITSSGVQPTRLHDAKVQQLAERLLIAHPGGARPSSGMVEAVAERLRAGEPDVTTAHHDLNALAEQLPAAIASGDLGRVADLINSVRRAQARLHPDAVDDTAYRELTRPGGLLAAKPCGGAGAGAAWLLLCEADAAPHLTRHYTQRGFTTLPVTVAPQGVHVDTTAAVNEEVPAG